jgi:hypothetical protein
MDLADGENEKESRTFDYRIAKYGWRKFTGTKLMELGKGIQIEVAIPGLVMKKESHKKDGLLSPPRQRANAVAGKHRHAAYFAVCIDNEGYKASLELGKLYRILPDKVAQLHGLVRVIDESGEDYAYSTNRFHSMKVSPIIERALLHTPR